MRSSSLLHGFILLLLVVICLSSLAWYGSIHAANISNTSSLRVKLNSPKWSIASSPSPDTADNLLNGGAAVSANDAWTVGYYTNSGSGFTVTLIEHWNGTNWSVVPSQNPEPKSILNGIAAVSSNDVWAVGYQQITNTALTLVEHWDGTSWSIIPSPNGTSQQNILTSIAAFSANDVWAVGYDNTGDPFVNQTLIEHWNGVQWSIVPSPNPAAVNNVLTAVTTITTSNIWVVGYQDNTGSCMTALIEHWNGKNWQQ